MRESPRDCSHSSNSPQFVLPSGGGGDRGGKRDHSWSSPGEESGGDEEEIAESQDRPQPSPRAAPSRPSQRPPAGSAPSAARRDARTAVSTAPVKFTGVGLADPPYCGFRPGSRLLAAGGCARMAAPLTPASARPCPPGRGHSSGGIFQPVSPTFHPFTWTGAERFEGPIHALPRTSAELSSSSPHA